MTFSMNPLKKAMQAAGHVLSEGEGFLVHELQTARDWLHSIGMGHIGDDFHMFETEIAKPAFHGIAKAIGWVKDEVVAEAEKLKAEQDAKEAAEAAAKAQAEADAKAQAEAAAAAQAAAEAKAKADAEAAAAAQAAADAKAAQDAVDAAKAATQQSEAVVARITVGDAPAAAAAPAPAPATKE